ncbi:MAG: O-antigen ligase family protein, partial [Lachnospiraceae bacterium]|nr:O-antigen ligase family protein [Lachnospiraceae bacterium]
YRGYIWATSLPLIGRYMLTGSGADTFMLALPQDDYAVKYSANISELTVFEKAHNMYLQMFITTGGVSLLSFISLIVLFCLHSRTYLRKRENPDNRLLVNAVVIGVTGFLITALVNDSSVSVMPVFYGLIGSCIGMIGS